MKGYFIDLWSFNFWHHRKRTLNILINAGFLVLGVILLIWPGLQNGFPILHSDSGTYLLEGFGHKIPVSRPLPYCLFVRFSSYVFSLWSVVILQALIVYWMIRLTVNTFFGKKEVAWLPFIIFAILSVTTGLSYYVSQIMADIFLPVAMMAVFVLLRREEIPLYTLIMIGLILWLSLIVHMSNLPVITSVSLAVFAVMVYIHRTFKILLQRKIIILFFILLISWLTNPFISLYFGEGFRLSNSSSIVFFSRLMQAGAAQQYIKDKCQEDDRYYLCKYLDEIDHYNRYDVFLWNDTSFLYDHPCKEKAWDACWRQRNEEFGIVNSEILSHPASRKIYLNNVWKDFLLQLKSFELSSYVSFSAGSHIEYPIKRHYANDYNSFIKSRQYKGPLIFKEQNVIIRWTIILSLVLIIGLIIRNKNYLTTGSPFFIFILIILFGWIVNGILTAMLAVVTNRFLGRFIWLVPLLAILMIYQEFSLRKKAG